VQHAVPVLGNIAGTTVVLRRATGPLVRGVASVVDNNVALLNFKVTDGGHVFYFCGITDPLAGYTNNAKILAALPGNSADPDAVYTALHGAGRDKEAARLAMTKALYKLHGSARDTHWGFFYARLTLQVLPNIDTTHAVRRDFLTVGWVGAADNSVQGRGMSRTGGDISLHTEFVAMRELKNFIVQLETHFDARIKVRKMDLISVTELVPCGVSNFVCSKSIQTFVGDANFGTLRSHDWTTYAARDANGVVRNIDGRPGAKVAASEIVTTYAGYDPVAPA